MRARAVVAVAVMALVPSCGSACEANPARLDILTMTPRIEPGDVVSICFGEQRCYAPPYTASVDGGRAYLVAFPDRSWMAVEPETLSTEPVTVIVRLVDGRALTGRAPAAHRLDSCSAQRRQEVTLA